MSTDVQELWTADLDEKLLSLSKDNSLMSIKKQLGGVATVPQIRQRLLSLNQVSTERASTPSHKAARNAKIVTRSILSTSNTVKNLVESFSTVNRPPVKSIVENINSLSTFPDAATAPSSLSALGKRRRCDG